MYVLSWHIFQTPKTLISGRYIAVISVLAHNICIQYVKHLFYIFYSYKKESFYFQHSDMTTKNMPFILITLKQHRK